MTDQQLHHNFKRGIPAKRCYISKKRTLGRWDITSEQFDTIERLKGLTRLTVKSEDESSMTLKYTPDEASKMAYREKAGFK